MNTNELSAKYIYEDKERLQMALHVYEAMPAVRKRLIEGIFKAVGEYVDKKLDGVEVECYKDGMQFYTEETDEFYVYAELERSRGTLSLHAGVYTYEGEKADNKTKRDDIRERFETKTDLETWSYGKIFSSSKYVAYAYVHPERVPARWDQDDFLRRAILNQDEVVSGVAELLMRIYEGLFVR